MQAEKEMDAGDIWSTASFPIKQHKRKSSLYNQEVTEAGIQAMMDAVDRFAEGNFTPEKLNYSKPDVTGILRHPVKQSDRKIDWINDMTSDVLRKIYSGDGQPGLLTEFFDENYFIYDAHEEKGHFEGQPGTIIGKRHGAVLVKTSDGSIWIGHMKKHSTDSPQIKLNSVHALGSKLDDIREIPINGFQGPQETYKDISYSRDGQIGRLKFDFYNGAMSTRQCTRLLEAYNNAKAQDTKALIIEGNDDAFSNGIHLNEIEASKNPELEAWENINAINDVVKSIIQTPEQVVISAVKGNAGAGGVALALASDIVVARKGSVLNMHYKNLGLYGSEYHTYSLPRRVGRMKSNSILQNRLPLIGDEAAEIGMVDYAVDNNRDKFNENLLNITSKHLEKNSFQSFLENKHNKRQKDEQEKPLEAYREEELNIMLKNIFQNNLGFREKRKAFVFKTQPEKTCSHIAIHNKPVEVKNNIIDGRAISRSILEEIREEVDFLYSMHEKKPFLAVIRVGNDPASISYIKEKLKACEIAGIGSEEFYIPKEESHRIPELIEQLNKNPDVNGILLQFPLPEEIQQENYEQMILSEKDVDGIHWTNFGGSATGSDDCFVACTPKGVLLLLKKYGGDLIGKHAVVIGKSNIVGKPLANLIMNETGATVTICHKQTKDLSSFTKQADILVVAAGVPNLITADMVKEDAIVIDVGVNRVEDKTKKLGYRLSGDVDFEEVKHKAKYITPVPGGVGPLTVASLVSNTLQAFIVQQRRTSSTFCTAS